jgi:hypothetical protein
MSIIDLYKVAPGWGNTAGLTLLDPQPRSTGGEVQVGLQFGVPRYGADGSAYFDGQFFEIKYVALTLAERNSLDSQFGVVTVSSAKVTVSLARWITRSRHTTPGYTSP